MACVGDGLYIDNTGMIQLGIGPGLEFYGPALPNGGRAVRVKTGTSTYLNGTGGVEAYSFFTDVNGNPPDGTNDNTECVFHRGVLGLGKNRPFGGGGSSEFFGLVESFTNSGTITVQTNVPVVIYREFGLTIRGVDQIWGETLGLTIAVSTAYTCSFTSWGSRTPASVTVGVVGGLIQVEIPVGPGYWRSVVDAWSVDDRGEESVFCGWQSSSAPITGATATFAAVSKPLTHVAASSSMPPLGAWTQACADTNSVVAFLRSDGKLGVNIAPTGARTYEAVTMEATGWKPIPAWSPLNVQGTPAQVTVVNPSTCYPMHVHAVMNGYMLLDGTPGGSWPNRFIRIYEAGPIANTEICQEDGPGTYMRRGESASMSAVYTIPAGGSLTLIASQGVGGTSTVSYDFVRTRLTVIAVNTVL